MPRFSADSARVSQAAIVAAPEELLTVRQVAARFGVCTATVYKWAAGGILPHVRIVNVIRVRREDLAQFIANTPDLNER